MAKTENNDAIIETKSGKAPSKCLSKTVGNRKWKSTFRVSIKDSLSIQAAKPVMSCPDPIQGTQCTIATS